MTVSSAAKPASSPVPAARRALSLSARAAITLALLVAAVVSVAAIATAGLNAINFQIDNIYNFMLIPINAIQESNRALGESQQLYWRVLSPDVSMDERARAVQDIQRLDSQFQSTLTRYEVEWVTTTSQEFTDELAWRGRIDLQETEVALLGQIKVKFAEYLLLRDAALPHIASGESTPAEIRAVLEASEAVEAEMDRLIAVNLEFAQLSFDDAVESYRLFIAAMFGVAILTGLLGVIVVAAQLRAIIRPLNALREAADRIAGGQLGVNAPVFADDEIGSVAKTFNNMSSQILDSVTTLEQRIADRTRAVTLSAEVGRRISTILDQRQLVTEVVEQLRQAFNYYHAHIYLFDDRREQLLLVGGTGDAGQAMLERGHKIPRGRGLVGRAAETAIPVLVPDVTKEPNWLPNPLLPDTKAEAAVPIAIGDRVLGVLDVQQNTVGGLRQEDVEVIQSIANQVAVALQNTRAYAAAQRQADREALINTINQKIQGTDDVDSALQVAARELGRALNAPRVRVRLRPAPSAGPTEALRPQQETA